MRSIVFASVIASASKIDAVVHETKNLPKDSKVIVFSQFTRMLDLICYKLQESGIQCEQIAGETHMAERAAILKLFSNEPRKKAILISFQIGAEALNIQAADFVVLVDPWWNSALELQAIQRAHLIGQVKPVHAVRFVTTESIEERIMAIQARIQLLFDATVGLPDKAVGELNSIDFLYIYIME